MTHVSMLLIMVQESRKYIWEPTPFDSWWCSGEYNEEEGILRHEMTSCQCHTNSCGEEYNTRARALL